MTGISHKLEPGTQVDRYEVVEPLGDGGFGSVYVARHAFMGQRVALKVLHPELVGSQDMVERFFREARAAAAVGSPHIVRVYDCGVSAEGQPFLAMELLAGHDLSSLTRRRPKEGDRPSPVAQERAVDIVLQTLEGLAAAHGAGVIHRDLKPANIFLTTDPDTGSEHIKILDFGVSKVQQEALDAALTRTGMWLGTPMYMAPEQFKDPRSVDHRADLYSVAVVLYQLLASRLPIDAETPMEAAYRAMTETPPSLGELAPYIPRELAQVVDRGLAKNPEARWPDAHAFAAALREAASAGYAPSWLPREARPAQSSDRDLEPAIPTRPGPGSYPSSPAPFEAAKDLATPAPASIWPYSPPMGSGPISTAPSGATPEAPDRRWALLGALFIMAGVLGGAVVILIVLVASGVLDRGDQPETTAEASQPAPTAPAPRPNAAPPYYGAPPQAAPPYGAPFPNAPAPNWGVPPGAPAVPVTPPPTPPITPTVPAPPSNATVEVTDMRVVGRVDHLALEQLLEQARPHLERCRPTGPAVRVQVQAHIHIGPGRITLASPGPQNTGPEATARCCANALRGATPPGWNPGSSGIVFFDFTLPGR